MGDIKEVCPICGVNLTDKNRAFHEYERRAKYPNGAPMFAPDGTMLDEQGNRSIFDDVDE